MEAGAAGVVVTGGGGDGAGSVSVMSAQDVREVRMAAAGVEGEGGSARRRRRGRADLRVHRVGRRAGAVELPEDDPPAAATMTEGGRRHVGARGGLGWGRDRGREEARYGRREEERRRWLEEKKRSRGRVEEDGRVIG